MSEWQKELAIQNKFGNSAPISKESIYLNTEEKQNFNFSRVKRMGVGCQRTNAKLKKWAT